MFRYRFFRQANQEISCDGIFLAQFDLFQACCCFTVIIGRFNLNTPSHIGILRRERERERERETRCVPSLSTGVQSIGEYTLEIPNDTFLGNSLSISERSVLLMNLVRLVYLDVCHENSILTIVSCLTTNRIENDESLTTCEC
jgi:hypothetical protein